LDPFPQIQDFLSASRPNDARKIAACEQNGHPISCEGRVPELYIPAIDGPSKKNAAPVRMCEAEIINAVRQWNFAAAQQF
jgi:hypothetical protein